MAHIDFKPKGSNISTLTPNPMTKPVVYGPLSSTITIRNQQTLAPVGTSNAQTTVIGRGKKVTMLYGTAADANGVAMAEVWIQVKQGSNTAMVRTDINGDYVLFDGQVCTLADGVAGPCAGAWTSGINFGAGNASTTMTIHGQGIQAPSAAFPTGKTSAQVKTVTQSTPLTTISTPVYTFTQKKGDASNRTFRFLP